MRPRFRLTRRSIEVGGLLVAWAVLAVTGSTASESDEALRHAVEMAQRGNWREAAFRWEQVRKKNPENPRVLNNLAIAYEMLGQSSSAGELYHEAAMASEGDPAILENARRYALRCARNRAEQDETVEEPVPLDFDAYPAARTKKSKGKTFRVTVGGPVPSKLKQIRGDETLLAATFMVGRADPSMPNVELARFLQSGLREHKELGVIDIATTPVRRGQSFEEIIANRKEWRLIGQHNKADVIVTGAVNYSRMDVSGVEEQDPADDSSEDGTFVEREKFRFMVNIYFINAHSGLLMFRDRVEGTVVVSGVDNDPTSALVEVQDAIAADLFLVVATRVRPDTRRVFKK